MRRTNAGTELHDEIARRRIKMLSHLRDRLRNDRQLGSLFARMDKANDVPNGIDHENRATIRDVDPQGNAALICDQAVCAREAPVFAQGPINHRNLIPVHLLGGGEGCLLEPKLRPNGAMRRIQPSQRFRPISRNIDPGDASDKTVPNEFNSLQRREKFQGRLRPGCARAHRANYFPDGSTEPDFVVVVLIMRVSTRLRIIGSSKSSW